jgi:hypothetical protein
MDYNILQHLRIANFLHRAPCPYCTVGHHKFETITNVQNHLISHKLEDRLNNDT